MKRKCLCGCGQLTRKGNKFINGHNKPFKGRKHSEKAKQKMSEARKNAPPISDEIRKKISEAGKGRKVSEATRNKIARRGERHHNWKGGIKKDVSGRVFIRIGIKEYKARSRIIMEEKLGRILKSSELVHHINGNPSDDRIENLIILNRSKHISGHNKGKIHSLETKKKIGVQSKGRFHSEETKKKISEASKNMWQKRRRIE